MGGQVEFFGEAWGKLTADPWVLNNVEGVKIPFEEIPEQRATPYPYRITQVEKGKMDIKMIEMEKKGIIEPTVREEGDWVSNVFPRDKPDGSVRIILDLTQLNLYIEYLHFKMSSLTTALEMVREHSWLASIDLKDAYFSIPVHWEHRKYLKFQWRDKLYQFRVLPNGLACAPRYFTKLLTPLFAEARQMGIQCFHYIDDVFVMGDTQEECAWAVRTLARMIDELGFVVHPEKSALTPAKKMQFLGFMIDTELMNVTLPEEKIERVEEASIALLEWELPTIRFVASVLGLYIAYSHAVEYGLSHVKNLERDKNAALLRTRGNFEGTMTLSVGAIEDVTWWLTHARTADRKIRGDTPDVYMETDASKKGWGAFCNEVISQGRWKEEEIDWHINIQELLAILFGIQSFVQDSNVHIHVASDNTTAVSYIRRQGGVQSAQCNEVAHKIWGWAEENKCWVTASYLPGKDNVDADYASRHFQDNLEWEISPKVFDRVTKMFGEPEIDLFACRSNAKCQQFVSWHPDPESIHVDAMTLCWTGLNAYAFPPFSLIPRVLQKIETEKPRRMILITPTWPTTPWYTRVRKLTTRVLQIGRKFKNI